MRTYFWNCIIYNIDYTIPETALQQAYQKPVALGQSVNSNVAPVAWVVGHPWSRLMYSVKIWGFRGWAERNGRDLRAYFARRYCGYLDKQQTWWSNWRWEETVRGVRYCARQGSIN
jgi:hypothetical protein